MWERVVSCPDSISSSLHTAWWVSVLNILTAASHRLSLAFTTIQGKIPEISFPFPFYFSTKTVFKCLTQSLLRKNFGLEVVLEVNGDKKVWGRGMWVNLTKWTKNGCKLVSNVNAHKRARRIFIIKLVRWLILWTSIGLFAWLPHSSHQFSSVAQLRPTLCDSMDCSMPGFPIHHHLPELAQTHVHRVSDAIQPPHPFFPWRSISSHLLISTISSHSSHRFMKKVAVVVGMAMP